jgi:hypothetical protein
VKYISEHAKKKAARIGNPMGGSLDMTSVHVMVGSLRSSEAVTSPEVGCHGTSAREALDSTCPP